MRFGSGTTSAGPLLVVFSMPLLGNVVELVLLDLNTETMSIRLSNGFLLPVAKVHVSSLEGVLSSGILYSCITRLQIYIGERIRDCRVKKDYIKATIPRALLKALANTTREGGRDGELGTYLMRG